ncbi:MAG: hypothetical protein ACRDZ4_20540 [Egibacteraceae bacterium]
MRDLPKSELSDPAEKLVRIAERADRQRKAFDKAMEPILERLRSLAEPAERTKFKVRRIGRDKT